MNKRKKTLLAEINVVPYIDVMLVLLVIFMITAPMLTQGVKIDLPTAKAEAIDTHNKPPIIVSVDKNGDYYINAENQSKVALSQETLLVKLVAELRLAKQSHKQVHVLVKGDKTVPYGKVMNLMVLIKHAGVKQVGLMTKPLPDENRT